MVLKGSATALISCWIGISVVSRGHHSAEAFSLSRTPAPVTPFLRHPPLPAVSNTQQYELSPLKFCQPTLDPRRKTFQSPSSTSLSLALAEDEGEFGGAKNDPLVKDASKLLYRLSWLSWWAQLILTVISSVTLVFARNVILGANSSAAGGSVAILPNFLLAGSSIVLSYVSIFWTWATRRLARRLVRKRTTKIQAANMLRKDIRVGVTLNLMGMALTILGAEQIIGALAIKVLTTSRTIALGESSNLLQPLDILVVQANTNTLFSHFCSITALLYLTKSVTKLDPPSTEGDVRD